MIALGKFVFFNVLLGLSDVSTDLATFFNLAHEDHPLWAALTAAWMATPFCVNAITFLLRVIGARCNKKAMGYASNGEFLLGFYEEVVIHVPFVSSVHNLWRAKLLYNLNYGRPNYRMRDSAKVEQILVAAGKGSYSESMYEAGPQSVTQVFIVLSTGRISSTQIFSLVTSVLSLSWGASRSFLIMRTPDQADPDPELMTVALRIWPRMLALIGSRFYKINIILNELRFRFDWSHCAVSSKNLEPVLGNHCYQPGHPGHHRRSQRRVCLRRRPLQLPWNLRRASEDHKGRKE